MSMPDRESPRPKSPAFYVRITPAPLGDADCDPDGVVPLLSHYLNERHRNARLKQTLRRTKHALREREEELDRQYNLRVIAEARLAEADLPPVCDCGHLTVGYHCPKCGKDLNRPERE